MNDESTKPENERPTPETDAVAKNIGRFAMMFRVRDIKASEFASLAQAELDRLGAIERQRDEARDELAAINSALGYSDAWASGKTLSEAVSILRIQRDELLEALEALVNAPAGCSCEISSIEMARWGKAVKAIAKVKGNQ